MSELTMWPVDMAPPNNLRRGDIVVNVETGERGIVTDDPISRATHLRHSWPRGRGTVSITRLHWMSSWVSELRAPVSTIITGNAERQWRVDKPGSTVERVMQARLTWRPLSMRTPEDVAENGPADDDSEAWHLLWAMLDEADLRRLGVEYAWPTTAELAMEVARKLDG